MTEHPDPELQVTVCSSCLRASCWNYEDVCREYRTAGVKQMTVGELLKLGREHPSNWRFAR